MLQVEAENQFERIGGTSTGGGTFWGLGSLLTGAKVSHGKLTQVLKIKISGSVELILNNRELWEANNDLSC